MSKDKKPSSKKRAQETKQEAKPTKAASASQPAKGRRFTPEQREHALRLVVSGMERTKIAAVIGTTPESIRRWVREAKVAGTMPALPAAPSPTEGREPTTVPEKAGEAPGKKAKAARSPYAPKDPGQGLSEFEVAAILELKKKHPSMGPAQIRAQLKRFKGWRVSVRAIARVLKEAGYELVHVASRPKGDETPRRWEAPHRNALWQMDFAKLRVGPEKRSLLLVQDDFSRYLVGWSLIESPTSEAVVDVLQGAIGLHGKPEGVYTDRDGPFMAWGRETSLGRFLENQLIDHHVSPAYRPQGRGKIEALIAAIRRELWEIEHFSSVEEAEKALDRFFERFNHRRAHMGIDGLTPADRYFGRADKVRATVDALTRKRQGVLAQGAAGSDDPVEEIIASSAGAPLEVLRLMLVEDVLELRFCGARVRLGRVEP